jgi:hypothetical protein
VDAGEATPRFEHRLQVAIDVERPVDPSPRESQLAGRTQQVHDRRGIANNDGCGPV